MGHAQVCGEQGEEATEDWITGTEIHGEGNNWWQQQYSSLGATLYIAFAGGV